MLTLHAFFILALSPSVIALVPYGTGVLLKGIKDERLKLGKWARLKSPSGTESHTWTYRHDCDDFIKFIGKYPQISVYRPQRTCQVGALTTTYCFPRPGEGDDRPGARLTRVRESVTEEQWQPFLDGTFWGREADIIGKTDSGLAALRTDVVGFTWSHEGLVGLVATFYTRTHFTPELLGPIQYYVLTAPELTSNQLPALDILQRPIRGLEEPVD